MYRDAEQREFARELRRSATPAERRLWQLLRAEQLAGFKFRRQAAIGAYIVDFVCFDAKVIVELDGPQHFDAAAEQHDAARDAWLRSRGFEVLRFRNHEMDEDIHAAVDEILAAVRRRQPVIDCVPPPQPSPPGGGSRIEPKQKR
ncbi:MAG: DUF559 domain-containing protein [Planctomycetales bacterium]|nr:DUF559 domain-containing protein [Planctomycetales bacterium]